MRKHVWLMGVALVGLTGCFPFYPSPSAASCAADPGCSEGDFEYDAVCESDADLLVRVGGGEGEFGPLEEGEAPPIIYGAQGGRHTMLGVEVERAELERYDRLRVEIGIYPASQCALAEEPCTGEPSLGHRIVILGEFDPLEVDETGVVRASDIFVFLDDTSESMAVIEAIVEDPCGRYGRVQQRIATHELR